MRSQVVNEARNDDVHGYQALAEELRESIRAGVYAPGAFLPTERELQESFGVSRSTIRRALSALADSGWAIIKPKRGVAAALGPMIGSGGNVAFIDHADLVNERLYFALSSALQGTGYHLIHVDSRVFGVVGAMEYAADNGFVAAFVWSKNGFPDPDRIRAVQKRMPLIALDHSLRTVQTDLVTEDNLGGARMAVSHLIEMGHRRIAITGMMDMLEINHERFSGYLWALFDHSMRPSPRDFVYCVTSGMESADTRLLETRLADPDRPDGIFVLQDVFAPAVVEAVFARGLRIPEDIAIVTFNGEWPVQVDDVGLTTVGLDWTQFAHECVRVLEARLQMPREPFAEVVLPVSLIVRGSCGAPREMWAPSSSFRADGAGLLRRVPHEYLQIRSDAVRHPVAIEGNSQ